MAVCASVYQLSYGICFCIYVSMCMCIQDKYKALEMFKKAADRGSPDGQYYLGMMHFSEQCHVLVTISPAL